jgi:glutathione synthase/RimK-type ligase-like ATP-grasp enzyme
VIGTIALVTADVVDDDVDLAPLLTALRAEDVEAVSPCWDDATVDWSAFDLVVMRSPWDYVDRYDEFVEWVVATATKVRVLNPPSTLIWNMDKRYLADLRDEHGLAVVATQFFDVGDEPVIDSPSGDVVVKPVRGAGSVDALRHASLADAEAHLRRLLDDGRAAMAQPYMAAIEAHGETGLVYFDRQLSHAFRKGAILTIPGVSPVDGLYAPEEISAREPSEAERRLADAAIDACDGDLLYARVDLVPADDGQPMISELELTEPSYFVEHAPGSAARFARAVSSRLASGGSATRR